VRYRERTILKASPDRVWTVLADWETYTSWMPDVASVRRIGPDREAGLSLAVRTKVFGVPLVTDRMVVTAWEPGRRMAIQHQGLVQGWAEWRLEPVAEGTRFTWVEDLRMPPPVLGEIALRLYSPFLHRSFHSSISNLARKVERPA
jgi:carbon monoxide dehydrogenase subunit G